MQEQFNTHGVTLAPDGSAPSVVMENLKNAGKQGYNADAALLAARIIKINGDITAEMADIVISRMLMLDGQSKDPITLMINSGGGYVNQGFAIIDMMNWISSPVHTCGIGDVKSMGATILMSGAAGHRSVTPNACIMIHMPFRNNIGGNASVIEDVAEDSNHCKNRILTLYEAVSKLTADEWAAKTKTDYILYATEAIAIGVVDHIIGFPAHKAHFSEAATLANENHVLQNNKPKQSDVHGFHRTPK